VEGDGARISVVSVPVPVQILNHVSDSLGKFPVFLSSSKKVIMVVRVFLHFFNLQIRGTIDTRMELFVASKLVVTSKVLYFPIRAHLGLEACARR
jgi:hypothetical protein